MDNKELLVALYLKYKSQSTIYNHLKDKLSQPDLDPNVNVNDYVTIIDSDYPETLKNGVNRPPIVFPRDQLVRYIKALSLVPDYKGIDVLKFRIDQLERDIKELKDERATYVKAYDILKELEQW